MTKIVFNNNIEFKISSYNKTTYITNNALASNGSCTILVDNSDNLDDLCNIEINSIEIYSDDEKIYELNNLKARITNYIEQLNEDRIDRIINILF